MIQTEFIGKGSVTYLKEILSDFHPKNIFLVTGKTSYERSGAKIILDSILKGHNMIHFSDLGANPKISSVEKGIELFKENHCDFVIAVGGGSVMDTGKLINIFAANPMEPVDYIKKKMKIESKGKTFVAVPTTSGSGSEATKFAVVNIGKTKSSLENDFFIPDYAIIDYRFTRSLSRYQTACTGMDALGQAIESYWGVNSTEESKKYSVEAIKLIMENLPEAVNNSEEAREHMAKASFLAGKAINITRTAANHAVSYPITSYFNVPHGHAVGLTIPSMIVYNSQVIEEELLDKRGVDYVKKSIKEIINLIGEESAEGASKKITNLMKKIGLSVRLNELGIKTDEEIETIRKSGKSRDQSGMDGLNSSSGHPSGS